MKKQMKRTVYEAPVTERFSVELEGGFMAGSAEIENPDKEDIGRIDEQQVNSAFNATFGDNFGGESNWQ